LRHEMFLDLDYHKPPLRCSLLTLTVVVSPSVLSSESCSSVTWLFAMSRTGGRGELGMKPKKKEISRSPSLLLPLSLRRCTRLSGRPPRHNGNPPMKELQGSILSTSPGSNRLVAAAPNTQLVAHARVSEAPNFKHSYSLYIF